MPASAKINTIRFGNGKGVQVKQRSVGKMLALLTGLAIAGAAQAKASAQDKRADQTGSRELASVQGKSLSVRINADGSYAVLRQGSADPVVQSGIEADVDGHALLSSAYPDHKTAQAEFHDNFGAGTRLTVTHTGLAGAPDLVLIVKLYRDRPWGEMEASVANKSGKAIKVQAIRSLHAAEGPIIDLNGPASADRILSDSYSEDRPQLAIRDLADGLHGMHRAVQSQLIYNKESKQSLFIGALTSDRLLTIFHLREQKAGADAKIVSYEVTATGTTEIMKGESLAKSSAAEQVSLSLPVAQGESLSGERLMFSVSDDYHAQLEEYGRVAGLLHHARVTAPTPIGWWSWTAYYFGLNQGAAETNAQWLAENLKKSGYNYFHIDEGYQYARGEYTTVDANLFPGGLQTIGSVVEHKGLTFGVWTAPFEVSDRAWVFEHHKDWLLHNDAGDLIHIGWALDHKDPLYVLDTTNPGAQAYLKETYTKLHDWGVRFIKMDFMDDTAVEGAYFKPNTTALQAQRMGLGIIRDAMGEDSVLDKDGSPMLNPVGLVDCGRISQDTGHTFDAPRDAATGIAARYYMNRNFFIADPDAFSVSAQTINDQTWHEGKHPATLDEAKVSIALSAVSGGMFEIGDDLPTLGASSERLALVKNMDLVNMARLGHASFPVDLMTYNDEDKQPSWFLLKEDSRQTILTVFNWTEGERERSIDLKSLGLKEPDAYQITEVFDGKPCCDASTGKIDFTQAPHSVRMLKLIDKSVAAGAPAFDVQAESAVKAGESLKLAVESSSTEEPILTCHWDFGDGVTLDGIKVQHAYTRPGKYSVKVTATGLDGMESAKEMAVAVSGNIATKFMPSEKKRPSGQQ
jgi:alpha-galactosidase